MVKIGGELWSARPYDLTQVIDAGEQVRVVEVAGRDRPRLEGVTAPA